LARDISPFKHTEKKLEDSFSMLDATIESTVDGILVTDFDGKMVKFNNKFIEQWRIPRNILDEQDEEKAIALVLDQLTKPGEFISKIKELNIKREEESFDILEFKDGRTFERYSLPQLVNGNCVGRVWNFRDITQRIKSDKALSLAQFTIQNTTQAIYWIKADSTFHNVNNAACNMLGYSFDELMEQNIPGIDPLYNQAVWEGFWKNLGIKKLIKLFTKHRRKDGVLIDVEIDTHFFKFDNIEMSCALVNDITERKKAEIKLFNSEERYRQIVETAQEGIWMIDENNDTSFVNKKMCEIIEYAPAEIMGKKIYAFMDEASNKKAPEWIARIKNGVIEKHDSKFITKTGKTISASLCTNPVFDDAGIYKGALAMVTDITSRKRNEELLQKSEASLAINNQELELKNRELEQFAYVASHDLQEPLRTTAGFADLLKQRYHGKIDERADKYLDFISDSTERMKVLINDLLDFSMIGTKGELKRIDCNNMLKDLLADIMVTIKEAGADIQYTQLPVINGYPTEIKLLFQNLVINAIKFRKKEVAPEIKISAHKNLGYWEFAVSDNGIGIEKKNMERIFDLFQRLHTRTEYEGSGIGLAHCKKIVELHRGKIWVTSELGEGSTFYFSLPSVEINIYNS
ncbi:MAG: PAS domain S-box protein, partial [Ferruginibacter sp.]